MTEQDRTAASEEERLAAVERVRKARSALGASMSLFTNREPTAEEKARTEAAKKEVEDATAELVRLQGSADVNQGRPPPKPMFGKN